MIWQLQEAKARFSEVIKKAQSEGPQHITVRGTSTAVVLSDAEYEQLVSASESLVDFMHRSPLYGLDDIEFPRDKSFGREVVL
jgi:prevent-host-death family protein